MTSPILSALGRRALLALAPLLLALGIPGAIEVFQRAEDGLQLRDRTVMVVDTDGPAARAGLRPRDLIVAVDDKPIHNFGSYLAASRGRAAGDSIRVRVRRDRTEATITLVLEPKSTALKARSFLLSLISLCFLFLGFATYLRRADSLGRYFHLSCLLFAYNFVDLPTFSSATLMHVLEGLRGACQLVWAAVFLRFFLIFPEGADSEQPSGRGRRAIVIVAVLMAPLHLLYHLGKAGSMEGQGALLLNIASAILVIGYLIAGVWVFIRKSLRRDRYAHWSRLRLAVAGITTGLAPLLITSVLRLFWPYEESWTDQASLLFLPLVPASFSMAILRSGAIDLSRLSRQALQMILLTLPFAALSIVVLRIAQPSDDNFGTTIALLVATGAGLAVAVAPVRRHVVSLADRFFYREQRRIRAAAGDLGHELSRERDPSQLVARFCEGIAEILGATRVLVYEIREGQAQLAGELGRSSPAAPTSIPADSKLVRIVSEAEDLLFVPPLISGPLARRLDEPSHELLRKSDAVALSPLIAAGDVVAILLFSAPPHGRRYGALQLYHVQQLTRQAAVALENARLHQGDVERERLRTELNLAREIQSKLLPSKDLDLGEFHICGRMQASMQVGGDLYDHFEMADGNIVVTVADASGKGVPASLLMSTVRSAVREIMRPGISPAEAMTRLNRELYDATAETHFIALFLGVLNPQSGVLEYTVGGIEPPIWSRIAEKRVELLTRGGAPLGIDASFAYRSGIIRMAAGDVVLAYSDGMIDEENEAEEPFGLSRLQKLAQADSLEPAARILDRLMAAVRGHGGEEAMDDRTLLVIQRNLQAPPGMKSAAS